jgi:hypothetical protein
LLSAASLINNSSYFLHNHESNDKKPVIINNKMPLGGAMKLMITG